MLVLRERMLVCRAGHLITERLTSRPDLRLPRCDRCGADTLDRCDTCGHLLGGAWPSHWSRSNRRSTANRLHGLRGCVSVGSTRYSHLPKMRWANWNICCVVCRGWSYVRCPPSCPRRTDLDILVRAVLPIHFDDIRPQARTPRYSLGNRIAFLLPEIETVVVAHLVGQGIGEEELNRRRTEDIDQYSDRGTLLFFVFDPERRLPERLEAVWTRNGSIVSWRAERRKPPDDVAASLSGGLRRSARHVHCYTILIPRGSAACSPSCCLP